MTSLALTRQRFAVVSDAIGLLRRGARFATLERVLRFLGRQVSRCEPAPGETACACEPVATLRQGTSNDGRPFAIDGWIGFPVAIADGTASGTVFLEASREAGVRARVVANLSVERGGYRNWVHFSLPFGEDAEFEDASYGLRATLVATDLRTGHKRLFGTPRAAAIQHQRSEAGVILELEEWD